MKFRKPVIVVVLAVFAAFTIWKLSVQMPYEERLIRIQAEKTLGHLGHGILNEPLDIQTLFLDYSAEPQSALLLKASIALSKYPEQTREVFRLYGSEPEFQVILRDYGEPVIPVIKYFLVNDILSIRVINTTTNTVQTLQTMIRDAWNRITGNGPTTPAPAAQTPSREVGSKERGWYAVNFIKTSGHEFLGQFVVNADGAAEWIQMARGASALVSFFTSGLRNLETKHALKEEIEVADVFFAGIDLLPWVASVKLLKAEKMVAAGGKEISLVSRTKVFASALIPKSELFKTFGKYAMEVATAYVVLTHPSLINSVLAEAAKAMGLNPYLVQAVFWFLIVTIALYPSLWLLKAVATFTLFSLSWLEQSRNRRRQISAPAPVGLVGV